MSQNAIHSETSGLYKFGFWSTLLCWLLAIPLSVLSIFAAQKAVDIWAWLNGPDFRNLLSPEYWVFGVEEETSYLGQMWIDSIVSFLHDFISYAVGLLFSFWCFVKLRRLTGWRISVSSVVMFSSVVFIVLGLAQLAANVFYSWKIYGLGTLGCDVFSREFYKCNYVLLEIPRISSAAANVAAAIFAAQVYSRRIDDTGAWVEDVSKKMEDRMSLYGALD